MAKGRCIFCEIVSGKIPAKKLYEDEQVMAFEDINPQAPVHVLLIPKIHLEGVKQLQEGHEVLLGRMHQVALKIARDKSIYDCGFRLVVNSGPDAGQAVSHLHYHLLGGRRLGWPPG